MQRNVTIGIVGVVVVSALVVGIGATALGNPAASVRPSQAAEVPTATPAGETLAAPTATVEPTASPSPTHCPDADPCPDARHRPGPADRTPGLAGRRQAASDRGHDRRPRRRAAAVGAVVRLGRLAGPGRGRHPALHGDLPGHACPRRSVRSAAPATTTSPGPPNGARSTLTPAARRRRRPPWPPRAAGSTSTTSTSSATAGPSTGSPSGPPRTTCTRPA